MAKNTKKQISIDENKVIEELKKKANNSINEIAKKCNFSRQKVWRIIKNLEKNNTIWGYTVTIDEEKQGKNIYFLLLKRKAIPVSKEAINNIVSREIDDHIANIGCRMINSIYTNGPFDWIIMFTAPNLNSAKKVNELFRSRYNDIITETIILESIFPAKINGVVNPDIEKLANFF